MTTTTIPDVPLPAGATTVTGWHRSPNGAACNRRFSTRSFPAVGNPEWLTVHTGGLEIAEDNGCHLLLRTAWIENTGSGELTAEALGKLADTLIEAGQYIAETRSGR